MSTHNPLAADFAVSDELSKAIQSAINPDDIRAAVVAEAAKQKSAADDQAVADKAAEDAKAAAAAAKPAETFTRVETIGGQEFTFEAESELELERMVNNAYKVAYAVQSTNAQTDPTPEISSEEAQAQAARDAETRLAANTELQLKFQRGEINVTEYIEQSGVLRDYLEKEGLPLNELKETVEQKRSDSFQHEWTRATEEFLNSPAGADWPGGDRNKEIIGMKIASMNMTDAADKVAALARAYASMKQSGMIFPYSAPASDSSATPAAVAPATPAPVATVPAAPTSAQRTPAKSSSIFGMSSGPSSALMSSNADTAKIEIPKDATPAEIIAAWKAQQIAAGKDPNTAFIEQFSARR